MKQFFKKNSVIIIAFLLPILLVVFVIIHSHISKLSVKTTYDFAYATCENSDYNYYDCSNYLRKRLGVIDGKLVLQDVPKESGEDKNIPVETYTDANIRFYIYDTEKNESREVLLNQIQGLSLNKLEESPDGVELVHSYGDNPDFIFFNSYSGSGYFLVKDKKGVKLNIFEGSEKYQMPSFKFLGWVMEK